MVKLDALCVLIIDASENGVFCSCCAVQCNFMSLVADYSVQIFTCCHYFMECIMHLRQSICKLYMNYSLSLLIHSQHHHYLNPQCNLRVHCFQRLQLRKPNCVKFTQQEPKLQGVKGKKLPFASVSFVCFFFLIFMLSKLKCACQNFSS